MKLTAALILFFSLASTASVNSQQVSYKAKNVPIEEVFNKIKQQTGYHFIYNDRDIALAKPVSIDVKNMPLKNALDEIMKDQPLVYEIKATTIVISAKAAPAPTIISGSPNETPPTPIDISGKITDKDGNPLNGASVKVKGTNKGTTTAADGVFVLKGVEGNATLEISFIGYETTTVAVNNKTSIIASLNAAIQSLQDVVVSKGYYDVKQKFNTGNVSIVTAKEIAEQPVSDFIQALVGRVTGLDIQQSSGLPGSYAKINIRGFNSIQNGNDPLYLVDGVPFSSVSLSSPLASLSGPLGIPSNLAVSNVNGYGGGGTGISPFSMLNPGDIEDIQVLKDADATAIYGSRGANGVILITTKKGKAGATRVDFDFQQGISQVSHFMDLLNTQQYLAMRHEGFKNDGIAFPSLAANPGDINYDVNGFWDTTRYTDWQKLLLGGTAHYTNAQVNISGGTANTQFLIGAGYNRQTTVFPGDYADGKGSIHLSLTHTSPDQKFHLQLTAGYVNDNNSLPQVDLTQYISLAPDAPSIYKTDGSINWQPIAGSATFSNPLSYLLTHANSISNNLNSNLNLSYELLPGLKVNSNIGFGRGEMNQTTLIPGISFPPPTDPSRRSAYFATNVFQNWIIEPKITYFRKIAKGELNALIGATYSENTQNSIAEGAFGSPNDALINNPQSASIFQLQGNNNTQYRYTAFYGRLGYNWDEQYLLNITGRRDGSSRFGPGKQFGNFGALGLGWIFSKGKFVKNNLPFLSFGKLRGSYGFTGNDQIAAYQYLSTYSSNSSTYQGSTTLVPASLQNTNLAWETVRKFEVGIELGFLKDRINLSASYYQNRSGNQLINLQLPNTTGFGSIFYNFPAIVQNSGFELTLNTINIKTKDFSWNTLLTFSNSKNKLISFPGLENSLFSTSFVVGQPTTLVRATKVTGVDPLTGNYTYLTVNSNGVPSYPQDYLVSAPLTPKYSGGLQNKFKYKNLQLDFFIQFVKTLGHSYVSSFFYTPGLINQNQPTAVLARWQKPGDITSVGRFSSNYNGNDPGGTLAQSSASFADASFLRLKNVSLSYSLPTIWQRWAHLKNTRIYLQGQNLLTLTKYIGLDPETQGLGLPPLRTITFGISASL